MAYGISKISRCAASAIAAQNNENEMAQYGGVATPGIGGNLSLMA